MTGINRRNLFMAAGAAMASPLAAAAATPTAMSAPGVKAEGQPLVGNPDVPEAPGK
ncbi:MAG: hypothetical protein JF571_08920, partial [Asticcacaulis sp.]|nr:hypothetical protein [Asticcacaulis sp.]